MERSEPLRARHLWLNPCGMCRSARSSSNSFPLCTCKTTSYLHIPQPLQPACLPQFAEFSGLTHLLCADTRCTGGRGDTCLKSKCTVVPSLLAPYSSLSLATSSESHRSKTMNLKLPVFTLLRKPRRGVVRQPPACPDAGRVTSHKPPAAPSCI